MSHSNRGISLIFNHETYDNHLNLNDRIGTNADARELEATLQRLRFTIRRMDNFTVDQIFDAIDEYSKVDHTNNDCILIVILTHGDGKYLYAKDDKYEFDLIWKAFNATSCPSLAGKPKLFFLQACQGAQEQPVHNIGLDYYNNEIGRVNCNSESYTIPAFADFLLAYSTIPGFVSYRDTEDGTWYIQSLCKELENADQKDILRILTNVGRRVAVNYTNQYSLAQLPHFRSMLIRELYFKS